MKIFRNNIREVKDQMSLAEMQEEAVKLIKQELNSKYYISLGAIAVKVMEYYKKNDAEMTFMRAMDLVDSEAMKVRKALEECAI